METMKFMDPKSRRRQTVMLIVGYILVGCAVLLVSLVLLFVTYGFGYKDGQVIQSGMLFVSSLPRPAQIYINGAHYNGTTNTRIVLPANTYDFSLRRDGYRDWQRSIMVQGGQVESYTYPVLFPASLTTNTVQTYAAAPALATGSNDRRWLLVGMPSTLASFDVYDLNNPTKAAVALTLPAGLLTDGTAQNMQAVAWAGDNAHLLLKHTYSGQTEYILLNRTAPDQSLNLTHQLSLAGTGLDVRLNNGNYGQYLLLNTNTHALTRATLDAPQPKPYLQNVLEYTTNGSGTVLYATPTVSDPAKVDIDLFDGDNTYTVRRVAARTTYLLGLASYQGDLYAAISASSENAGYVYQNPISQITNKQLGVAVPVQSFSIKSPDYVSFSSGGEYAVFEHGTTFAVYDADSQQNFAYTVPAAMEAPQPHAIWMDGEHLEYTSNGQIVVFDFDGQNRQTLVSANPAYQPVYDQGYKVLYTLVHAAVEQTQELLTSTSLRTPADQ